MLSGALGQIGPLLLRRKLAQRQAARVAAGAGAVAPATAAVAEARAVQRKGKGDPHKGGYRLDKHKSSRSNKLMQDTSVYDLAGNKISSTDLKKGASVRIQNTFAMREIGIPEESQPGVIKKVPRECYYFWGTRDQGISGYIPKSAVHTSAQQKWIEKKHKAGKHPNRIGCPPIDASHILCGIHAVDDLKGFFISDRDLKPRTIKTYGSNAGKRPGAGGYVYIAKDPPHPSHPGSGITKALLPSDGDNSYSFVKSTVTSRLVVYLDGLKARYKKLAKRQMAAKAAGDEKKYKLYNNKIKSLLRGGRSNVSFVQGWFRVPDTNNWEQGWIAKRNLTPAPVQPQPGQPALSAAGAGAPEAAIAAGASDDVADAGTGAAAT